MVNSILVPLANADHPRATIISTISKNSDFYTQTLQEPSTTAKTSVNGNQDNATTVKILEASLRQSTHCKYNNYIKHWLAYSKATGKIEVTHVLDFLGAIFEKGRAYSTNNRTKCVIATIVNKPPYDLLNKHPLI